MTAHRRHGTLIVTGLALLLLVGAGTAAVLVHMGSNSTAKLTVTETEYHLKLSASSLKPGKHTIVVVNRGHIGHSLAISGPGVKTRLHSTLAPGKSGTLTVTLKAGTYTLWCPVPGHAARGMRTRLTVHGTGGATSTGATTTTGAAWG